MSAFIPGLAGALIALGVVCAVAGLVPQPEPPPRPQPASRRGLGRWWRLLSARTRVGFLVAVAAGTVIGLLTGWLIAAVVLPVSVLGLPYVLASSPETTRIARLEALAEWTRNLAGVLTVGVGLEQALMATARSTPEPIRGEVGRLVARLQARWDTTRALRAFADELDDPTGDAVAGALILSARRRGSGLASVLTGLAESVADDVTARRRIEADRAKPRSTARTVTMISAVVLVVLAGSGQFLAPYASPLGQVVLGVLLGLYGLTLVWMRRMSQGKPMSRFIGETAKAGN